MGLFSKVKHFMGGHGVSVKFTKLERQAPDRAQFPLTDEVLKGNIEVSGDKKVTILSHDFEVFVERTTEDNPRLISAGKESYDKSTEIIGSDVSWPYTLKPGQVVSDSFMIHPVDLSEAFRGMGADPNTAIHDPDYKIYVKFTADVKGSPMDPEVTADLIVTL